MNSIQKHIYLACSFDKVDQPFISTVKEICEGIGLQWTNVELASKELPSAQAKDLIKRVDGLIAVASQRKPAEDGKFEISAAVLDEIAKADALDKPILLLREADVVFDGFLKDYGTYLEFSKGSLSTPGFLRKLVASLHDFKLAILQPHEVILNQEILDFYAESTKMRVALEKSPEGFEWHYSIERKLRFLRPFSGPLRTGAWPSIVPNVVDSPVPMRYSVKCPKDSKFQVDMNITKLTPYSAEAMLKVQPAPKTDDVLDYTIVYSGRYCNPLYKDELPAGHASVEVDGRTYGVFDGIVPLPATKDLKIQFRFPREYGLTLDDICVVAASYTSGLNYLAPTEIKRMHTRQSSNDGDIEIDLELDHPIPRFFYGIAWNPIKRAV